MATLRSVSFLLLLLLATACASPMTLPKEFVELKDPGEGYRAVTSDDARLRVRDLAEPTAGGVEFWAETLRSDLVQQRGYEPVDAGEVRNQAGVAGRWYQFAANVAGERVGYFVAVWVVDPWWPLSPPFLRVVEFAGRDEVFRARLDAVRAALATVRG
jgi:hypothetical protein